ncbi:hypothetical protein D3C81_1607610 [compost metagenome]
MIGIEELEGCMVYFHYGFAWRVAVSLVEYFLYGLFGYHARRTCSYQWRSGIHTASDYGYYDAAIKSHDWIFIFKKII